MDTYKGQSQYWWVMPHKSTNQLQIIQIRYKILL